MDDILSAYRTGAEMGRGFHRMDEAMHNSAVQGKMDEILRATAEHGGDLSMIDPSLYSDRVGLEAMGKVAGQMANTEAWKLKAMQNNAEQARHRFATFQQYFTDIEGAIKDGDQSRTVALMSNMASQSGTPYRFMPTEDGQIRVGFITPEGEVDKGTMSMTEAYDLLKPYATNQDRFIQDSVMYGMATQAENAEILQDPRRWKQATDGNGNQYTLIPQRIYKNGQLVSGFLVSGPGGQRNMTMEEVSRAGLLGGQGIGKTTANGFEQFAFDYVVGEDGKQQKYVNPYKADVLGVLVSAGKNPADIAAVWDKNITALMKANPELTRNDASILVREKMLGGGKVQQATPATGGDALDESMKKRMGGGVPDKGQSETVGQKQAGEGDGKTYTKNELRNGKAYTVTYDANGREVKVEPAKKSGKGMTGWRKNISETLAKEEEKVKAATKTTGGGRGLNLFSTDERNWR